MLVFVRFLIFLFLRCAISGTSPISPWNALIVKEIGSDWAKLFTDAHEYGIRGNLGLNAQMDLFNNSVGINLGISNKEQENWYIAGEVQKHVDNGWLLRNKVNGVLQNANIATNGDYR